MSSLVIGLIVSFVVLALFLGFVAGAGETSSKRGRR